MVLDQSVLGTKYNSNNTFDDLEDQYSLIKLSYEATLEADKEILSSILNESIILNEFDRSLISFDIGKLFVGILKAILKVIARIFSAFMGAIVKIIDAGKISSKIQIKSYENKIRDFRGKILFSSYRAYDKLEDVKFNPDIRTYFEPILEDKFRELDKIIISNTKSSDELEYEIKKLEENLDQDKEIGKFLNNLLGFHIDDISLDYYKNILCDKLYNNVEIDKEIKGSDIYSIYYPIYKDADKMISKTKKEEKTIERSVERANSEVNKKFNNDKLFKYIDKVLNNKPKVAAISYERKIISLFQREASYITTFYSVKLQGYKNRQQQAHKILVRTIQKIIQEENDNYVDRIFD